MPGTTVPAIDIDVVEAPEESESVAATSTAALPMDESGAGAPAAAVVPQARERTWRDVTDTDIDVNLVFVDLPPDHGLVTPINSDYRRSADTECIARALPTWAAVQSADVVQRTRNVLMIAGTADLLQMPIERDVPLVVFAYLDDAVPQADLVKILYWIAVRPYEGTLDALDALPGACLDVHPPDDVLELQYRVGTYATKLLGRLTGRTP